MDRHPYFEEGPERYSSWPLAAGIFGAIMISWWLLSKKPDSTMKKPPIPANMTSQNISQMGVSPSGYGPATKVTTNVTNKAKALLAKDMGYEEYDNLDGTDYFFRLEPHYHPPGYVGGPIGWHKGCSVYQKV